VSETHLLKISWKCKGQKFWPVNKRTHHDT